METQPVVIYACWLETFIGTARYCANARNSSIFIVECTPLELPCGCKFLLEQGKNLRDVFPLSKI